MKKFKFDLQRFSEGGAGAASSSGASTGDASGNQNPTGNTSSTDGQAAAISEADRKTSYEKFKAEYKDFYDADVKNNVKARHRDYNSLKADKKAQDAFLSTLHAKYGTSDLEGLQAAIDADNDFWRAQADQADMTVEQYKEHVKLKRERDAATGELNELKIQEQAREQYNTWVEDSKAVKEKYPEFDLNTELQDPRFRSMLSARYSNDYMPSMLDIYEIVHRDDILQREKQNVQQNTINNIKARGLRPDEAGSTSSGAVGFKKDVSQLTPKERAEFVRRASLGETITFS